MTTRAPAARRPRARKRFGQHFLEPAWVAKVVAAIAPAADDRFIEIGPGHGAITRPLAAAARSVVAFEIDRDLAGALRAGRAGPVGGVGGVGGVEIVEGDFLDVQPDQLIALSPPLRVVGNLPYNVSSPILFRLIDLYRAGVAFADATIMLQQEVADRIVAERSTPEYGVLTILVGRFATVERLFDLPPGAFRPAPKVRSALVRLRFHPPRPPAADETRFSRLVRAIFTRRRKTLANALLAFDATTRDSASAALELAGLDGRRRPETLDTAELVRLSDAFSLG